MSADEPTVQNLAEAILSDDLSPMPIEEIQKAWEEMKRLGLIAETGEVRNGQPVYDFTPRGHQVFDAAHSEVKRRREKQH